VKPRLPRTAALAAALACAGLAAGAPCGSAAVLGRAVVALTGLAPGERINVSETARRLGTVEVPPRGEFHFLEALRARGGEPRMPGRALVEGRAVEASGGGVCLVAGAVHAAALRADLGLVERSPHSAAVRSLPPGLDAAVSEEGGSDLVLWNGYRFPVRLKVRVRASTLVAEWSADSSGVPALVARDAAGALVRRLPDGREEVLSPAPTRSPSPGGSR